MLFHCLTGKQIDFNIQAEVQSLRLVRAYMGDTRWRALQKRVLKITYLMGKITYGRHDLPILT